MKAEHRKELETNTLADRMGRLLEGAKQKPQGNTVFWIILVVLVVGAAVLVMRWISYGTEQNSAAWYALYVGDEKSVQEAHFDKIQGQALRFDDAWAMLWGSIKRLGADPKGAREGLAKAKERYEKLREECETDPVLAPEAIYSLAVIEETLALEDRAHLNKAIDYYEEVSKKFEKSAYGQLAKNRLEILNSDDGRKEVNEVYQDLQNLIRLDRFDRKN